MFFVDGIMREFKCQNVLVDEEVLEIRSLIRKVVHFITRNYVFMV
jgi:hypothetical protein